MAINIDKMDIEIRRNLDIYLANTMEDVKQAVEETAKETVAELKSTSPKRINGGDYAKNWACKRDRKIGGRWNHSMVVYNKLFYRLTHLLEKGHETVNGSFVAARPHIKQAEENAFNRLYAKLVRKLRYTD